VSPQEALDLVRSDSHGRQTLWRSPDGQTYVVSRPGEDLRYFQNGFQRLGTLGLFRKQEREGTEGAPPYGTLVQDAERWS